MNNYLPGRTIAENSNKNSEPQGKYPAHPFISRVKTRLLFLYANRLQRQQKLIAPCCASQNGHIIEC